MVELERIDSSEVIKIITDYAAFGIYSDGESFDRYFFALKAAHRNGIQINMILQSKIDKFKIAKHQYAKEGLNASCNLDSTKLATFTSRNIVKKAISTIDDSRVRLKFYENRVSQITNLEWLELISIVEEAYVEEFEKIADIQISKYILSIHMWSLSRDTGILAFVNTRAPAEETGFLFKGNNERLFNDIFRVFKSEMNHSDLATLEATFR